MSALLKAADRPFTRAATENATCAPIPVKSRISARSSTAAGGFHKRHTCSPTSAGTAAKSLTAALRPAATSRLRTRPTCRPHQRCHQGIKPYRCPLVDCGSLFAWKANLRMHLHWHSGARPYACPVIDCGKSFAQKSNMQAHQRTHDKVRTRSRPLADESARPAMPPGQRTAPGRQKPRAPGDKPSGAGRQRKAHKASKKTGRPLRPAPARGPAARPVLGHRAGRPCRKAQRHSQPPATAKGQSTARRAISHHQRPFPPAALGRHGLAVRGRLSPGPLLPLPLTSWSAGRLDNTAQGLSKPGSFRNGHMCYAYHTCSTNPPWTSAWPFLVIRPAGRPEAQIRGERIRYLCTAAPKGGPEHVEIPLPCGRLPSQGQDQYHAENPHAYPHRRKAAGLSF